MHDDVFKNLNPEQKQAVEHIKGPSIILAGAGSGKTQVLVRKVLNMIINHNIKAENIIMITFTNKAAAEMKKRIGNSRGTLAYVGTFHSFCARLLRIDGVHIGLPRSFVIYDEDDSRALIKKCIKESVITKFTPSYFSNRISAAKNELISPAQYSSVFSDYTASDVATVYKLYQKYLKQNNAVDFDDLLIRTIELLTLNKNILDKYHRIYKYILVDEFQDTNVAQYILTRLLGEKEKNVTIVGDFSQSIYSWRGADIGNLEKFKTDFEGSRTFHLEQNYRSTQKILDFAYGVISKNTRHPILKLYTKNKEGTDIIYHEAEDEQQEALFIASEIDRIKQVGENETYAVLYRTNAQSRVIEEAFLHWGTPYILVGGTRFYERREIKDVLAYLRLLINPADTVATDRIKKLGKRRWDKFREYYQKTKDSVETHNTSDLMDQIFAATGYLDLYHPDDAEDYTRLENIKELKSVAVAFPNIIEFLEQVALVESEYFEKEKKADHSPSTVRLMTLHGAKGLEFDVVFIVGLEDGILPHSRAIDDYFQLEEERRLFYVGITRAKRHLYITYTRRRFIFGKRTYSMKSRFIYDGDSEIIQGVGDNDIF